MGKDIRELSGSNDQAHASYKYVMLGSVTEVRIQGQNSLEV